MAILIVGDGCYIEEGDCSEIKREIHIKKEGLKYQAYAFYNMDFRPINNGRFSYKKIMKDIEEYKKKRAYYYDGYEARIITLR